MPPPEAVFLVVFVLPSRCRCVVVVVVIDVLFTSMKKGRSAPCGAVSGQGTFCCDSFAIRSCRSGPPTCSAPISSFVWREAQYGSERRKRSRTLFSSADATGLSDHAPYMSFVAMVRMDTPAHQRQGYVAGRRCLVSCHSSLLSLLLLLRCRCCSSSSPFGHRCR